MMALVLHQVATRRCWRSFVGSHRSCFMQHLQLLPLETFNANELEVDVGQLVDQDVGVGNVLVTVQTTLGLFKALIDFIDKI